ncbi:MAG: hypothetical protein KDA61_16180, partial [Planctomycetales bacterium]|nr:hypothetical protein [Planctomycetales bacterium]
LLLVAGGYGYWHFWFNRPRIVPDYVEAGFACEPSHWGQAAVVFVVGVFLLAAPYVRRERSQTIVLGGMVTETVIADVAFVAMGAAYLAKLSMIVRANFTGIASVWAWRTLPATVFDFRHVLHLALVIAAIEFVWRKVRNAESTKEFKVSCVDFWRLVRIALRALIATALILPALSALSTLLWLVL